MNFHAKSKRTVDCKIIDLESQATEETRKRNNQRDDTFEQSNNNKEGGKILGTMDETKVILRAVRQLVLN